MEVLSKPDGRFCVVGESCVSIWTQSHRILSYLNKVLSIYDVRFVIVGENCIGIWTQVSLKIRRNHRKCVTVVVIRGSTDEV